MIAQPCPGCDWTGYQHQHNDAEDGPRAGCCAHTCRPDDAPPYPPVFPYEPCDWTSVDGYGCNYRANHAGWHERHRAPGAPRPITQPEWLRRQRASLLPAAHYAR